MLYPVSRVDQHEPLNVLVVIGVVLAFVAFFKFAS
jgi:hypothetical protein